MPERARESPTLVDEDVVVTASDGVTQTVRVLRPARMPPTSLVLCLPAMGTQASYYEPFARALADSATAVVAVADLRGQGTSSVRASAGAQFGYREILEADLPAIVTMLRSRYPGLHTLIAGHSLGGQLGALFAAVHPDVVEGLILIASGTGHLQAWSGWQRSAYGVLVAMVRASRWTWRWYPGRLIGFGGRQPHSLMRDWLEVVASGRYRPRGTDVDYEARCRAAALDLIEIGVEGDPIAPARARDALVQRFERARIARFVVPANAGVSAWRSHFAWARAPDAVVATIVRWMHSRSASNVDAPTVAEASLGRRQS